MTRSRRSTQTRTDGATGVVPKDVGRGQLSPRCALAEQRVEDVVLREQAARGQRAEGLELGRHGAREREVGAPRERRGRATVLYDSPSTNRDTKTI